MGPICAGKDSLKNYLSEKYGYHPVKLGNILRGEAVERGIKVNRGALYKLGQKLKRKDPHCLVNRALAEAEEHKWRKLVLGDIRDEKEVLYLKKKFGYKIKFIRVDASSEVRFKRIKNRRRAGDPKTPSEFKKVDQKEARRFNFSKVFRHADYVIVNNDGYEQLHREADRIIKIIK